ncbi:MAG: acetate/propionate family kinase [Betaproteobacteria bacterium]
MSILTVNTGSFSVRLSLFLPDDKQHLNVLGGGHYEPGAGEPEQLLRKFLRQHALSPVKFVAPRIVHGGPHLTSTRLLDPEVEREIGRLIPLAPLHNPHALKWIEAVRTVLGVGVSQVAVFDTAFYANLPEVARTYAIPHELGFRHDLRRYGFHGLAHEAMVRRWRQLRPDAAERGRTISLQLGAGCSVTAADRGAPVDTSMGFSPLEGLMMATRSGDVDPGLVTFLQRREGLTPEQMDRLLNERSGLLGVSGISADMRDLLESGDPRSRLAVDLYCYRARKYLGAYLVVLGGGDAILFGGGVGENSPLVRARILENMGWAGVTLDSAENLAAAGVERRISSANSPVEAWVIPVDEAAILAREALAAMHQASGGKQA